MRVEWGPDLPREVRSAIEPYVIRYLDILPPWVHTLQIVAQGPGEVDDCTIGMFADYRYRRAKIIVHPEFLDRSDVEREQTVIHEIVHAVNAPLVDFTDQLIEIVRKKDPDAGEMLESLREAGMEAATEDCSMIIWRLTEDRRVQWNANATDADRKAHERTQAEGFYP